MSAKVKRLTTRLRDGTIRHRLPAKARMADRPLEIGVTVEGDLVIRDTTERLEILSVPMGHWLGYQELMLLDLVNTYNAVHRLEREGDDE